MITSCLTFIFSSSLVYEFHSCRYFMSCNCIPSTECVVIVPPLSHVGLFVTPWIAACQTSPVLHYLLEFVQTHVHWVGDAIQPSHPLSSPSPFAFNLSQHQDIFQWVSSSHQVAKELEFQLQHQPFQCILRLTGLISLQPVGLSRVFSSTTVLKYQFRSINREPWMNFWDCCLE